MNAYRAGLRLLLVSLLFACDDPTALERVDYAEFVAMPMLSGIGGEGIVPAEPVDHWQLRLSWGDPRPDEILVTGGTVAEEQLEARVRQDLGTTRVNPPGLAQNFGCAPAGCYYYVVAVSDGRVQTHETLEELRAFLGTIAYESEAILLLAGAGYHWLPGDRATGAIRAVDGGFEAVVLELVSPCNPYHADRHLLRIRASGSIRVVETETWLHDPLSCI